MMVQVCVICLDTEGKLLLLRGHSLEQVYQQLSGHPINTTCYDKGNLQPALCVRCCQRLKNFSRLREQSLRAHSVMLNLMATHKADVTSSDIQEARWESELQWDLVATSLAPDHCDERVRRDDDDDDDDVVCTSSQEEGGWASDELIAPLIYEDDSDTPDDPEPGVAGPTASDLEPTAADLEPTAIDLEPTDVDLEPIDVDLEPTAVPLEPTAATDSIVHRRKESKNEAATPKTKRARVEDIDRTCSSRTPIKNCAVVLCDIYRPSNVVRDAWMSLKGRAVCSCGSANAAQGYTCDVCGCKIKYKNYLPRHKKIHTRKPHICDLCNCRFKYKSALNVHMRIHTGERPYKCKICSFNTAQFGNFNKHMLIHTAGKPNA